MKFKKLAALFLSGAMMLSIAAACSSDPSSSSSEAASTGNDASSVSEGGNESAGDYVDYSNGFEETVTVKIPIYDRAYDGWDVTDNYYTRWAQEELLEKYNIDLQYVAIGRTTEVQDYNQLLASHTAPDIIFHYDMPQAVAYYSEGVMQELDYGEVAYYAPSLWGTMGDIIEQYGYMDGKSTFVFAERPVTDNYTTIIRKDWVEAAGYTVDEITSLEKFNEVLLAMQEAGISGGKAGHQLVQNNFTVSYPFRTYDPQSDERALLSELSVADLTSDAMEAYLRDLNYKYNNGILDPEFYLRDDEQKTMSEFVSGNTATFSIYLVSNTDLFENVLANDADAEFAVLPYNFSVPEGGTAYSRAYWPFGFIMGINYETDDLSRIGVWMYLEWLSDPDVLFKWQNGIEGENYELDADGLAIKDNDYTGESALSQNNNKDYWALVTETAVYADDALTEKANRQQWTPPGYETLVDDLITNYAAGAEWRTPDALFLVGVESVSEYKADLNSLWIETYTKIVTASEADFDAVYADACDTWLDAGYQAILDEKQGLIDDGQYMW